MVWHGGGVFFLSGEAARAKDYGKAGELMQKGIAEMAAAVALEPENVGALIPRGSILLAASRSMPQPQAQEMLKTGLADYEKTYQLQKSYFDRLSAHGRSELLFGIAEAYERMGDSAQAKAWFEKLSAVADPANGHRRQAQDYLASGVLNGSRNCVGCHTSK
jgi:tetratricopeptide (TPR) repeat protein